MKKIINNLAEALSVLDEGDLLIPDMSIKKLNLQPIIYKLVKEEKWTLEAAIKSSKQYKQFLYLCKKYTGLNLKIVPTKSIDAIWHCHIEDTAKYQKDCEDIFGYFLHHFPYFGIRSDEDRKEFNDAVEQTKSLLLREFGAVDWFSVSALCGPASCGQGGSCNPEESYTISTTSLRPDLALLFAAVA